MDKPEENVVDGRRIYFCSLLEVKSQRSEPLDVQNSVGKYDDYLDTILRKHLVNRLRIALESKGSDNELIKMTQMNLLLHKIHKKEHEHFLKSLEEKDEWEAKATEYITRRNNELGQISEDCRARIEKMKQSIRMKNTKADSIEEFNKSCLITANVDYSKDEAASNILLL